jgi:hypothetical protein
VAAVGLSIEYIITGIGGGEGGERVRALTKILLANLLY